jgi:hypothetical protein
LREARGRGHAVSDVAPTGGRNNTAGGVSRPLEQDRLETVGQAKHFALSNDRRTLAAWTGSAFELIDLSRQKPPRRLAADAPKAILDVAFAWWGNRHLVLDDRYTPGELIDVDAGKSLAQAALWGNAYHSDSPDGRLWLSHAKLKDARDTRALVAFDPPTAETLAAIGPKTKVVNLAGWGVEVENK